MMDNMETSNKRSPVWLYFNIMDDDPSKAVCDMCKVTISRGNGKSKSFTTSALNNHLKHKHPETYKTVMEFRKPVLVQTSSIKVENRLTTVEVPVIVNRKQWYIDSPEAQRLHEAIGEMIAIDAQPYTIVEDIGFQKVLAVAEPKYNIPSRRYFAEIVIPLLYERIKTNVQVNINEGKRLSFTTDSWNSGTLNHKNESFVSIAAHWISDDFQSQFAVLHCQFFSGTRIENDFKEAFLEMLTRWDIEKSRVQAVLQDNGASVTDALKDTGIESIDCFVHTLQLCINNFILTRPSIASLIDSSRKLVEQLKRSSITISRLNAIQLELDLPHYELVIDVVNHWKSTFYMLERLLELKSSILVFVSEVENVCGLTMQQWTLMKNVTTLLKPFEQLDHELSKPSCTLSVVLPAVKSLLLYLNNSSDVSLQEMSDIIASVNGYFSNMFDKSLLILSMAVDPRFKLQTITNELKKKDAEKRLLSAVHELVVEHSSKSLQMLVKQEKLDLALDDVPEPPTKISKAKSSSEFDLWAAWDSANLNARCDRKISTSLEVIESEIHKYLAMPCVPRTEDPVFWWRQNENVFPNMSLCAKVFLAIPSTSFSIEQLFSRDRRAACLMQENFEQLVFLKSNLLNFQ